MDSNFNTNEQQTTNEQQITEQTTQQGGYEQYGQQNTQQQDTQQTYGQTDYSHQNTQQMYSQPDYSQQGSYQQDPYNQPYGQPTPKLPGQGAATASLILGIIGAVCALFLTFGVISVGCGIAGIIVAGNAKKQGYTGGMRTVGFILSLLSLIFGALEIVACIGCVAVIGATGSASTPYIMDEFRDIYDLY